MQVRAIIQKPSADWKAQTACYPIPRLCNLVQGFVGWCDSFDLVHDMLDRQGCYFFEANGFRVDFEVVA